MKLTHSLSVLAEHAAQTLPDSVMQRRAVLQALEAVLTASHPAAGHVTRQRAVIHELESLRTELPRVFRQGGAQ